MIDIASISRGATLGLVYDIHYIVRSTVRLIGDDHRIVAHDEEASTSHGPYIRSPTSSTAVRMHRSKVEGEGEVVGEVVVERGGGRPRGRAADCSTDETILPLETSIPPEYSTLPFETSAPYVIPPLSPTSQAL